MRGLFIFSCWVLGIASLFSGILGIPLTFGFSLVGGVAGLVFFGGIAGLARNVIETRDLMQRLYDQREQQPAYHVLSKSPEHQNTEPHGAGKFAQEFSLPERPLPPELPDTWIIKGGRYGIYAIGIFFIAVTIYAVVAGIWLVFR